MKPLFASFERKVVRETIFDKNGHFLMETNTVFDANGDVIMDDDDDDDDFFL
jgi:hypothetical protein